VLTAAVAGLGTEAAKKQQNQLPVTIDASGAKIKGHT